MPVVATIKYQGAAPGNIGQREYNEFVRMMFRAMGVEWHDSYRAKHFTRAGASEYGYAPREGERGNVPPEGFRRSYTGQKLRTEGHTRPLVLSGESEQQTRRKDIRATATKRRAKVRVHLHAPKLNFRNPHSKTHPVIEMTTISRQEKTPLKRAGSAVLAAEMKAYRKRRRVVKK